MLDGETEQKSDVDEPVDNAKDGRSKIASESRVADLRRSIKQAEALQGMLGRLDSDRTTDPWIPGRRFFDKYLHPTKHTT